MEKKFIEQKHYYFNEDGLMVFTSTYHLERGFCCGNGCLHCPYNYHAVPEPAKSHLQMQHSKNDASKNSME